MELIRYTCIAAAILFMLIGIVATFFGVMNRWDNKLRSTGDWLVSEEYGQVGRLIVEGTCCLIIAIACVAIAWWI